MAWVESHQELRSHPKTKRLARMLNVHRMQAIGHLHALWWWALDHAEDGDVSSYEPDDLADACAWDGDPDELVKALIECGPGDRPGFLEHDGVAGNPEDGRTASLVLHDWWDHAGKWIAKRARERQRKQAERLGAATSSDRPQDVRWTSEGQDADRPRDVQQPSQDPDLTGPDRTGPSEPDLTDLSGDADAPQDAPPDPEPPPPEPDPPKPQKRDELFEAVTDACGWDRSQLTKSARGNANNATGELRAIGATPQDVHGRASEHRQRWPGCDVTPSSLAKNWSQLGTPRPVNGARDGPGMAHRYDQAAAEAKRWEDAS